MKNNWVKITDKRKSGGGIWAWVTVGAATIGVWAANWSQLLTMLANFFGIK